MRSDNGPEEVPSHSSLQYLIPAEFKQQLHPDFDLPSSRIHSID